jgi:hypothetical protein
VHVCCTASTATAAVITGTLQCAVGVLPTDVHILPCILHYTATTAVATGTCSCTVVLLYYSVNSSAYVCIVYDTAITTITTTIYCYCRY